MGRVTCPICLAGNGDDQAGWSALECGHILHTHCMMNWFEHKTPKTCPTCKVSGLANGITNRHSKYAIM
jgi:hypothetical protein